MNLYELLRTLVSLFSVNITIAIIFVERENDLFFYIKKETLEDMDRLAFVLKTIIFEPYPLLVENIVKIKISTTFDGKVKIIWNKV